MRSSFRPAGAVLAAVLAGLLAGCGGGFSGGPDSPPDPTVHSYVALGDSFAAAPGVGNGGSGGACKRSDTNYPSLVAADLDIKTFKDVSCAGATTASLTTETTPEGADSAVPAQLDAVDDDADLVTINVGLGDRDVLPHSFEMCLALPCGDKVTPQVILSDVSAMSDALTSAVRAVQDKAPEAYVVLVGYPTITPAAGSCEAMPDVDQASLDAANRVLDEINREVRFAARDTGVGYLDVARLSMGHELCSSDPWVETSKGKKGGRIDYRPVAAEQRAVAKELAALVRNH